MLGIHGVGRDKADYYLSDLARELPVAGPGHWAGRAAVGLGLGGPVSAEGFQRLLEGRHPRTGLVLGTGRTSVAAFDLTFSAPKSASVVFALAGTDAARTVVAAHAEAVAGSLSYLERHAITATRRIGPDTRRAPDQRGAGRRLHARSQPERRPAHPQPRRRGQPRARSRRALGCLRPSRDRRPSQCRRGGVRGASARRIDGGSRRPVEPGVPGGRRRWRGWARICWPSSRAGARTSAATGTPGGCTSARGARIAWAATRPSKGPGLPFRELTEHWQRRADAVGADLGLEASRPPRGPAVLDEHRFAGVIALPAHGGAHRRDVVAAFGVAAADGATAPVVERLVDQWVPDAPPGVAEPLEQRRTVVPANHHLRALGPRPVDPDDHAVWLGAARRIDAYRDRWGLTRATEPLGEKIPAQHLAALPADRLADHVRTERDDRRSPGPAWAGASP